METLFEQFPEAIKNAGTSLYALLGLIVLVTAVLAMWLISQKATNRQERVLIYIILFFTTISAAVGIAAGFSSGAEVVGSDELVISGTPNLPEADPYSVTLEPRSFQKLEEYISSQGINNSHSSKSRVIATAIDKLIAQSNSSEANEDSYNNRHDEVSGEESVDEKGVLKIGSFTKEGFKFDSYGCGRAAELGTIQCTFIVTNLENDKRLRIHAGSNPKSRIIADNSEQYNAKNISFAMQESEYVAEEKLVKGIEVKGTLTFLDIPEAVKEISLLEINGYSRDKVETLSFQFRDIFLSPISE